MSWFKRLFGSHSAPPVRSPPVRPCDGYVDYGGRALNLASAAIWHDDLPHPNFDLAREWADYWVDDDDDYDEAWLAVQRGWLGWLAACLGQGYRVYESEDSLLVTAAEPHIANAALSYLNLTQRRVARSLAGIASERLPESQVVLLLNEGDDYYRYLTGMNPDELDSPMSSGVHFGGSAPHVVINGNMLDHAEATLVHEMTHAFVTHLTIPAWLNEGLAVNMEIAFGRAADGHRLIELQTRHRKFWTPELIQDYWSGRSWLMPGESNELSYDLGRLMVAGMSEHWPRFEAFVLAADGADAGANAAHQHIDIDLGEYVRHYLEREDGDWAPRPDSWQAAPERGAF